MMAGDLNCVSAKCTCFVILCIVIMHYKRLNTVVPIQDAFHNKKNSECLSAILLSIFFTKKYVYRCVHM